VDAIDKGAEPVARVAAHPRPAARGQRPEVVLGTVLRRRDGQDEPAEARKP